MDFSLLLCYSALFTMDNSVRSDRSGSQLLLVAFVGNKYLLMYTNTSKGWEPKMTFTFKIKNCADW